MQGVGGSSPLVFTTETTIFVRKLSFHFCVLSHFFMRHKTPGSAFYGKVGCFSFLCLFAFFYSTKHTRPRFFLKVGCFYCFENQRNIKTADAQFSITAFYTEPFSVYRCICQLLTCARLNFKVVCKLGVAESAAFPFVEFFGDIG